MLAEIVLAVSILLGLLYYYVTMNYNYWKNKGVEYIVPEFPFGTPDGQLQGLVDIGTASKRYYDIAKKNNLKYVAGFLVRQPHLLIIDLELSKRILTKDFNHFVARDVFPITHEFLSKNLFFLDGEEWKKVRAKLSPVFSSGKIKNAFSLVKKCNTYLQRHIEDIVLKKGEFEVKDLMSRYTTDTIATFGFGLDLNSFSNSDNTFYKLGQLIFIPSRFTVFKCYIHRVFSTFARFLNITILPPGMSEFLLKLVKDTIEHRIKHNITRGDLIGFFLNSSKTFDKSCEATSEESKKEKTDNPSNSISACLTLEEITAQSFVFLSAGLETSASATMFCLYELAKNPDVQTTLREEIDETLNTNGGELTYQAMKGMTYMEQVVNETLRRYSSFPVLTRVCTEPYHIPDTNFVIDKGVRVTIPNYAIQHDPDIYPDPFKFDPGRFSKDAEKERHPYAFLPFGAGPRFCIGMRFAELQIKLALTTILSRYVVDLSQDTPLTIEIDPNIFFTTPKQPFNLKISRRTDTSCNTE